MEDGDGFLLTIEDISSAVCRSSLLHCHLHCNGLMEKHELLYFRGISKTNVFLNNSYRCRVYSKIWLLVLKKEINYAPFA